MSEANSPVSKDGKETIVGHYSSGQGMSDHQDLEDTKNINVAVWSVTNDKGIQFQGGKDSLRNLPSSEKQMYLQQLKK